MNRNGIKKEYLLLVYEVSQSRLYKALKLDKKPYDRVRQRGSSIECRANRSVLDAPSSIYVQGMY